MITRRTLLATIPTLALAQNQKFVRSFFYLKPDSKMILIDFAVGSDKRMWAIGGIVAEGRGKGTLLSSIDGGLTWQQSELKFLPRSLFALDDSSLWAVSEKGEVWFSAESGREWKKLSKQDSALRVHFLNNQTGYLVGIKKTFMRTDDGGKTWRHVPEAAQVAGAAETFSYNSVQFWNGKIGLVSGSSQPSPRRRRVELPEWMEPELANYRDNKPHLLVSLETMDGGATWRKQEVSGFGSVHRSLIANDGTGLTLIKFNKSFDYGGEVYSFYPKFNKKSEMILRLKDLEMQDILYIPGDGAYLACTERLGPLPVPTKVHIKHSKDLQNWTEIPVDYRAIAQKITLGATPSGKVFAALDQGTILALR
ncbi:MAG: YCF48-related protein [Acidobacteria bacterium]|nr:YCF48-related protein [Acidobacteriota bacterium]